jgi:hypothetical protein
MSFGIVCLRCRQYVEGGCRCPNPQPSENGKTPLSINECGICGKRRGPTIGAKPTEQWYCPKHNHLRPATA